MAYSNQTLTDSVISQSAWYTSALAITAASTTVLGAYTLTKPITVQEIYFFVATAVNNYTNAVLQAQLVTGIQNATPVTTSICTMTIPNGATASTMYVNNGFTPVTVPANCNLQFAIKTQGSKGGTPAGAGFFSFFGAYSPEHDTNYTAYAVNIITS